MDLKRYATDKFILETMLDDDRLVWMTGYAAEIEIVEMNSILVTTPNSRHVYEVGVDIEWLTEIDGSIIPPILELLEDYDLYRIAVSGDGNVPKPRVYLDDYENEVNDLPAPLRKYFLKLFRENAPAPLTIGCYTQLQTGILKLALLGLEQKFDYDSDTELLTAVADQYGVSAGMVYQTLKNLQKLLTEDKTGHLPMY